MQFLRRAAKIFNESVNALGDKKISRKAAGPMIRINVAIDVCQPGGCIAAGTFGTVLLTKSLH